MTELHETRGKARFGVLRLGPARIALDVETIREVIPMPAQLEALPLSAPWLLGAINLRGVIISVVDLARLLGSTQPDDTRSAVAVVVHEGQLLGLLVDNAADVVEVAASQLQPLRMSDATSPQPPWLTHCFEWGTDHHVISVLSITALRTLGKLPWIEDRSRTRGRPAEEQLAPTEQAHAHLPAQRRPYLYFRCEDVLLGLDAQLIHTSQSHPAIRNTFLTDNICQGVTEFNGQDLAVIDLLAFLGLGQTGADAQAHMVVLRLPAGLVGVLVTEVLEVLQVADAQIKPLPAGAVVSIAQFSGVTQRDDGQCVMFLHTDNLLTDAALKGWASIHQHTRGQTGTALVPGPTQSEGPRKSQVLGGYLSFEAGGSWLVRLVEVSEILPFPERYARTRTDHPEVMGLFLRDDHAVLLVSLNAVLKRPVTEPDAQSKVLVVRHEGHRIGFVVQSLTSIEPLGFEVQEPASGPASQSVRNMVFLGHEKEQRLATVLELDRLAQAFV